MQQQLTLSDKISKFKNFIDSILRGDEITEAQTNTILTDSTHIHKLMGTCSQEELESALTYLASHLETMGNVKPTAEETAYFEIIRDHLQIHSKSLTSGMVGAAIGAGIGFFADSYSSYIAAGAFLGAAGRYLQIKMTIPEKQILTPHECLSFFVGFDSAIRRNLLTRFGVLINNQQSTVDGRQGNQTELRHRTLSLRT